jgi:hypothetical protein
MRQQRIDHTSSLQERLADLAQCFREEAETRRPGQERDELIRKARQAETALHISEWVASPDCGHRNKPFP